mgnify:CR=1 FL=1
MKKPFRLIAPRQRRTRFFHARFTALEKPMQRSTHTQNRKAASEWAWLYLREKAPAVFRHFTRLHGNPLEPQS